MATRKLRLEDVQIESFETASVENAAGTVKAHEVRETPGEGTCWGQTGQCTACPPIHCY